MSDRDSVTCVITRGVGIRPVESGNRLVPSAPTDQILGHVDSYFSPRFLRRFAGSGQTHRAYERCASAPGRTSGPLTSQRTRIDRALRTVLAGGIPFLVLFWALPSLLLAAQQQDPPLRPDNTVSPVEFARVAGQVETFSAQLTAQYALTEQTLNTINTIITVYSAVIGFLILVLGYFGYRNLRSDLQRALQSKLDEQLRDSVSDKVDEFLADMERTWDARFTELLHRVTHLSDPRS